MGDPNVARRLTTWHGGWCGQISKVVEEESERGRYCRGERERERERERCIEEREKFNKIKRKCFSISINTVPIVELYYSKIYLVFKTFDIGVFLVC